MSVTGGSIGIGMPLATGAAIACPDRKVICLEGDGSGMYTLQALWTQARETCDVVNVIFANRTYEILKGELMNVGGEESRKKGVRHAGDWPSRSGLAETGWRHGSFSDPGNHCG